MAHDAWALSELCFLVLVELLRRTSRVSELLFHLVNWREERRFSKDFLITYHFRQASGRDNVPRMHQPVQMPCRLLDGFAHLIVAIQVEDIGDKVEGILVVLNLGVEARQVEAVGQVVFVNLAKVLVAS